MTLDEKVDDVIERQKRMERQLELLLVGFQQVMLDLGIREKIEEIAEKLELRNGSHPTAPVVRGA
jgi:hypothetical protein